MACFSVIRAEIVDQQIHASLFQRIITAAIGNIQNIKVKLQVLDPLFVHSEHLWVAVCNNKQHTILYFSEMRIQIEKFIDIRLHNHPVIELHS